ncbi:GTP cyclohydrolase I [Plectosphaerella cucumerina]|uniref:GTP cyclohydrolase 1 n=1 Tax=Plectosphaerella cucumerina TaxID=40658 RepID=A0A8K0TT93_9PEZI|nr:GTP cyclohydrolase I [Plectosphaerella cucumerina]
MAGSEVSERKRRGGNGAPENADGSDAESASQGSRRSSKDKKRSRRETAASSGEESDVPELKKISKKKRKHTAGPNGSGRRPSLSLPARDPRDSGAVVKASKLEAVADGKETRSPSPMVDFDGLSRPSKGTRERLEETPEQAEKRLEKLKGAVRTILECVGEDPDRSGILDTPKRYAKAMLFFTKGYQQNVRDIVGGAIFHEGHNEMVIVKSIDIFSLCEHHLVPFTGKMHIAYIPRNQVIGISKLPRIAEMFARRLQIQERLTKEVANAIMEILKPRGVAVVMESSHLCMVMRGVEKTAASTITSCVLGCFERQSKTRNEFFSLVGLKG